MLLAVSAVGHCSVAWLSSGTGSLPALTPRHFGQHSLEVRLITLANVSVSTASAISERSIEQITFPAPHHSTPGAVAVLAHRLQAPENPPVTRPLPEVQKRHLSEKTAAETVQFPRFEVPKRTPRVGRVESVTKPAVPVTMSRRNVGAQSAPSFVHRPEPVYPPELLQQGIEGTVLLWARLGIDGRLTRVRIEASSGYTVMDHAALIAVQKWRLAPAKRNGKPLAKDVVLPIIFRISKDEK